MEIRSVVYRLKGYLKLSTLQIILLLIFAPNVTNAETISYTTPQVGCNVVTKIRPDCTSAAAAVLAGDPSVTVSSCSPSMVTTSQYISCNLVRTYPYPKPPLYYTYNMMASPHYSCLYGGSNAIGVTESIAPFVCTINTSNLNQSKNLGGSCNLVGNPINARTGNKYIAESDYDSQSLEFTRYYNSKHNKLDRHIGFQWQHSYSHKLTLNQTTDATPITFAERPDGKILFFKFNNNWASDADISDRLTQLPDGSWKLLTSDDAIEHYDINGRLLSISNRNGHSQILTYDVNGRLVAISDDTGRELNFIYDSDNRIKTLINPAGGQYVYGYDNNNNLVSVTYPDGKIRTYHYNESAYTSNTNLPYALTGITDENGIRYAIYTYDTKGRAIVTEHAGGTDRYAFSYSTNGSSTVVTDPLGSQYTRQFQTIQGVAKDIGRSQPAGSGCNASSSNTTYDSAGNVASSTDFNGNKTCYAYDLNRNLETARIEGLAAGNTCPADLINYAPASNSAERKIITDWHSSFRLPIRIIEAGRETSYVYDTYGNITQYQIKDTTTNATRTWNTNYTYHATIPGAILQKAVDGPRTDVSDVTTINYYAPDAACAGGYLGCRGQIASITNALGHVTQITRYSAHGQPEEIVDPNSLITSVTYDVRQRLISRTSGTKNTYYQYDDVGQIKKATFTDNSFLSFTYDNARRLTAVADNLGNRVQYTLDAMSNRTQEKRYDPANTLANSRQREFDALNRLWKDIGAQSQTTQYSYDAQGNLKQVTDPLQHTVSQQFDALNRLTQMIDPLGSNIQQNLDKLDQVTKVTDPRNIDTTYTYNGFGDLIQENSADRGITTYTNDEAGNLKTLTDARGVVHTYTWDALNRPTSRTHATVTGVPGTDPINWSYDAGTNSVGRLTGMSDESGSTSFNYDLHGRLLNKSQTAKFGTLNYSQALSYQYDSQGRLNQMTYPSGTQVSTTYGLDGRPTEIRVNGNLLISNITYLPFGEPKSWVWGNGQTYTRSFDLDGRLTQHPIGSDTRTLSYDAASRITNTTDTNSIYNRSYDYDPLNHLTGQTDNSSFKLWVYDSNSNRTATQIGGTSYPYTLSITSNRLLDVAGPVAKTYSYDAAGSPLTDGITNFSWSAAGSLFSTTINTTPHFYKYNGLGQRITKDGPLSKRYFFLYDPTGQLIGEYQDDIATTQPDDWLIRQETIWLEDIPVAVIKRPAITDPIQIYFIHADHLNTPRLIVDQNNTPVWRWENVHAFGANLPDEDPDGNSQLFEYNLRFPGQYFDQETGLHYNYFRYYEPETGRYLTPDPIGLGGGLNTYGYVNGNPLSFTDPTGEIPITPIIIGGLIGTGIDLTLQLLQNGGDFGCTNWKSIGTSALSGAVLSGLGLGFNSLGRFSGNINKAPDFVVSRNGTVFPVPKGAIGPTQVISPNGKQTGIAYTGGSGGANGQITTMRIMNPTLPKGSSPGYPRGYVKYENSASPKPQGVDPYTGKTLPNSQSHFPID